MGRWVSLNEAAPILGVSVATLKRRIRDGTLETHSEERAQGWRYLVEIDDPPATNGTTSGETSTHSPVLTALVDALTAELAAVRRDLDHERQRNAELWQIVQRQALPSGDSRESPPPDQRTPSETVSTHPLTVSPRDQTPSAPTQTATAPPQRPWWRFWA